MTSRREFLDRNAALLERETLDEHEIAALTQGMDREVSQAAE